MSGIDPELLAILVCPCEQHGELTAEDDRLRCQSCGRSYPVVDNIPVMLLDQATPPSAAGVPAAD